MNATRPRRRSAAGAFLLAALMVGALPAAGQDLGDIVKQAEGTKAGADSLRITPEPAPWPVVTGQVVVGTVLAAAAGYGVGTLAETLCDDCDGGRPGGDSAGMVVGVPLGALFGSWFIGKLSPPTGRFADTAFGALAGTAVFAGFAEILDGQSDGVRWTGVIFPAALAAMGWNRSRPIVQPQTALHESLDPEVRTLTTDLVVFRVSF